MLSVKKCGRICVRCCDLQNTNTLQKMCHLMVSKAQGAYHQREQQHSCTKLQRMSSLLQIQTFSAQQKHNNNRQQSTINGAYQLCHRPELNKRFRERWSSLPVFVVLRNHRLLNRSLMLLTKPVSGGREQCHVSSVLHHVDAC